MKNTVALITAVLLAALLANAVLASGPVDVLARMGSVELGAHDARMTSLRAELATLPPAPELQNVARIGWHSSFSRGEIHTFKAPSH